MKKTEPNQFVVLLHNIRSLHNVGSIFRTADAAEIGKIYLCGITPSPLDRFGRPEKNLTKVSLGAEKYVPWKKVRTTGGVIKNLKSAGYRILAVEQSKKSIAYDKFKTGKNKKIALILGNEVKGLPSTILKKCDKILEIPMRGAMVRQAHHPKKIKLGKESLNVSVSFGIVALELARQLYKI